MKPRVVTFIKHYIPGYAFGGPVRSLANIVDNLGAEVEFSIVTLDRDVFDKKPYEIQESNTWNTVGAARVLYISPEVRSLRRLQDAGLVGDYDVVYLNSFFDYRFSILPFLWARRGAFGKAEVVVAPRGEFSSGALAIKRFKKLAYVRLAKGLQLYKDVIWHASGDREEADIKRVFGRQVRKIVVAPNLPPMTVSAESVTEVPRDADEFPLRVLFLSRITYKKGLDYAIRILREITVPVEFNIVGPAWELSYWRECELALDQLPTNVTVKRCEGVPPEQVPGIMQKNDLLFFPTRGENFGHVILESLSVGTPVLISDQTPWEDDERRGCTVVPLDNEQGFVRAIEEFFNLTLSERAVARKAAQAVATRFIGRRRLVGQTRRLFLMAARST